MAEKLRPIWLNLICEAIKTTEWPYWMCSDVVLLHNFRQFIVDKSFERRTALSTKQKKIVATAAAAAHFITFTWSLQTFSLVCNAIKFQLRMFFSSSTDSLIQTQLIVISVIARSNQTKPNITKQNGASSSICSILLISSTLANANHTKLEFLSRWWFKE